MKPYRCREGWCSESFCPAAMADLDIPPWLSRGKSVSKQRQEVWVRLFKSLFMYFMHYRNNLSGHSKKQNFQAIPNICIALSNCLDLFIPCYLCGYEEALGNFYEAQQSIVLFWQSYNSLVFSLSKCFQILGPDMKLMNP